MILRLTALCYFGAYLTHAMFFNFLNDDAFISFRYAQNLASHGELTFNLGERVEGYTNFLWTLLMSGVMYLGGDVTMWSRILGILFGVATIVSTVVFLLNRLKSPQAACLAATFLILAPAFACWSTGGLETMMFTFFITSGWLNLIADETHKDLKKTASFFALSALTRPEGLIAFALAMGLYAYRWLRQERPLKCSRLDSWQSVYLSQFMVPILDGESGTMGGCFPIPTT